MQDLERRDDFVWPLWQKLLFRFFFIYFLLFISPWSWLNIIPGAQLILDYVDKMQIWAVIKCNAHFFHVFNIRDVKPFYNGSGDTSYFWAEQWFHLAVAFTGGLIWSVSDRKRKAYNGLNYILRLALRYSLALIAFDYGISKIFLLQMHFPSLSQMATPLGDLLPMRFSWLFIGYSAPYEIFSGIMEVLVGLLLIFRRTATMGVLVATVVFVNVMMLNLCYDIPVKLYAMNIVLMCFYLIANQSKRIINIFVYNRTAEACALYHYPLHRKWMRVTRIVLKLMVLYMVIRSVFNQYDEYKTLYKSVEVKAIPVGIYNVNKFVINKDTITPGIDTLRWQDMILEKGGAGSINTKDTSFKRRYGRGYFNFTTDTNNHTIAFKKLSQDSTPIFTMNYFIPDSLTIQLRGKKKNDSLYVELKKSDRHFQLAERQFHWLSEANR